MKRADVGVALYVLAAFVMFIISIPSWILDILLAINIAIAFTILFTCMFSKEVLDMSYFPSLSVTGAPRLSSVLLFPASVRKTLPMSAGFISMWSMSDTDGSSASLSAVNFSMRMSISPAKLRSARTFQMMMVSDIPSREIELRMLIPLSPRKWAACALAPGTSFM